MLVTPRKLFGASRQPYVDKDLQELLLKRPVCSLVTIAIERPVNSADSIDLPVAFTVKAAAHLAYGNALFLCTVKIPTCFPFAPPSVFMRNAVLHPNVDAITNQLYLKCLDPHYWSPVITLKALVEAIQEVLVAPALDYLPTTPLNLEMAQAYAASPSAFTVTMQQVLQGGEFAGKYFQRNFGSAPNYKRKRSTEDPPRKCMKLSCV